MIKHFLNMLNSLFNADDHQDEPTETAQAHDSQQESEDTDHGENLPQTTDDPMRDDMTERVVETLRELGFQPENTMAVGYVFKYEGASFLYMPTDDRDAIKLTVPCVFETNNQNVAMVYYVMNIINRTIRHSKACLYDDKLWIIYEYALRQEPYDLKAILTHMIPTLDGARIFARHTLNRYLSDKDLMGDFTTDDSEDSADELDGMDIDFDDDSDTDSSTTDKTDKKEEE